jgi:hypothetical protein
MKRRQIYATYTLLDEMMASPTAPMPLEKRRHQLTRMWGGLAALEQGATPTTDDWRTCSDAVNLLETLVGMGEVQDTSGLLLDAVEALALAGGRHTAGQGLRLSGQGMQAIRAVLEDYAACLEQLSARTMVRAHRRTEKRVQEILAGKRQAHDVTVMAI